MTSTVSIVISFARFLLAQLALGILLYGGVSTNQGAWIYVWIAHLLGLAIASILGSGAGIGLTNEIKSQRNLSQKTEVIALVFTKGLIAAAIIFWTILLGPPLVEATISSLGAGLILLSLYVIAIGGATLSLWFLSLPRIWSYGSSLHRHFKQQQVFFILLFSSTITMCLGFSLMRAITAG